MRRCACGRPGRITGQYLGRDVNKGGEHPILVFWIYSWLVADFTILSAQLTRRLGPGEDARERRHPSDARLECSFYAQLP